MTCPSCGALSLPPGPDLANSIADQLGRHLGGRYRIERELGEGGMAIVYLAHDFKLKRPVAMKVMRPDIASMLGAPRFLREIDIAAHLDHPGILALYDSGEAGGLLYYVMPFEEGQTLRARIEAGALPVAEALRIGQELADALAYAHEQGVVHRDIKPENVLFLPHGHVAIADFGIARMVAGAGATGVTTTAVRVGSPLYMSPEHFVTGAEVGPLADVYSLGCVMFEMLTGAPPYDGSDYETLMRRHCSAPIPSARAARPDAPLAVDRAVRRALAKTPALRYRTAAEFGAALGAPHLELKGAVVSAGAWLRRRAVPVAALLAALAAGTVTMALLARRTASPFGVPATLSIAVPRFLALNPALASQAQQLAEALGGELARVPRLSVMSGPALRDYPDATPQQLRERFGVGQVVVATLLSRSPLTVSLRLVDARSTTAVADTTASGEDEAALLGALGMFVRRAMGGYVDSLEWRRRFRSDSAWHLTQIARTKMNTVASAFLAGTFRQGAQAMDAADSLVRAAAVLEPGEAGRLALARSRTSQAFMIEFLRQARLNGAASLPDPLTIRLTAIPVLDSILARHPNDVLALRVRGSIKSDLMRVGGPDSLLASATRDLERATQLDELDAQAWSDLASCYGDSGLYEEQLFAYGRVLSADQFLQLRDVYLRGVFDAALRIGENWRAQEACGAARREFPGTERFDDCELKLLAYTTTTPAGAARAAWLADSLVERRKNDTDFAMWHLFAAQALARAGRAADAQRQLRLVESRLPLDAMPTYLLTEVAAARLLLRDADGAISLVRRAIALNPRTRRFLANDRRFSSLRRTLG